MAHAVSSPPILRIKESSQSGTKAMAAAYASVYTESCTMAMYFAGAKIDLTNMAAGDTIDIQVQVMLASAGNYIAYDTMTYNDAQPVGHLIAYIAPIPELHGINIQMRQTAGVLRNIDCQFFDAKRIGLV